MIPLIHMYMCLCAFTGMSSFFPKNKKEVSSVHEQLTKQTEKTAKYKMKSQTRKAQVS